MVGTTQTYAAVDVATPTVHYGSKTAARPFLNAQHISYLSKLPSFFICAAYQVPRPSPCHSEYPVSTWGDVDHHSPGTVPHLSMNSFQTTASSAVSRMLVIEGCYSASSLVPCRWPRWTEPPPTSLLSRFSNPALQFLAICYRI